jgi:hypothetical protein
MARPDLDDGWLKYAHELDAALAVADFTKGARIVLREVFAQIFGPAKLAHAELSPTEIGRRCGMNKAHVMRAITELIDSSVLVRHDQCSFTFVKDYERWTYKGRPRLTETEISYARHAPRVALSYRNPYASMQLPNEVTNQPDQHEPVTQRGNETLPNEVTPVTQRGNETLPNEVTDDSAPYRNGRAEFETGEELRQETGESVVSDSGPIKDVQPVAAPEPVPMPLPELGTASGLVVASGRDSADAVALESWASHLGTDRDGESYCRWARQACDYAPAAWIRALLERRVKLRTDRVILAYLNKILGKWVKTGVCEYLKGSGPESNGYPRAPDPPMEYHTAPATSVWRQRAARNAHKP